MAEPINFHRGNRAEYLARFALSAVGYVVPTPRETDKFIIDLFLHLGKVEENGIHVTGPTLAFQVKSSRAPIELEGPALKSFLDQKMPIYIALVDVKKGELQVFCTFNRVGHSYYSDVEKLTLKLQKEPSSFKNSGKQHVYHLGKPIVSVKISKLDGTNWKGVANQLYDVLKMWSYIDLWNLAYRSIKMPIIAHIKYDTNIPPNLNRGLSHYIWHPILQSDAAQSLEHLTHQLATFFKQNSTDNAAMALAAACEDCRRAATAFLRTLESGDR